MRWLTVAGVLGLLCVSRSGDAAVLKCSPESQDPLCASEERDISPPPSPPDVECLAGSEWESNCHYCRCSESGVAECLKQNLCESQLLEDPIQCKPFTTFQKDCNTCTCLENGIARCSKNDCLISINIDRRKRNAPAPVDPKCTPGSSWKESCNSCWCTDAGISVCTKIGCLGNIVGPKVEKRDTFESVSNSIKKHGRVKRGVCKPNQEFQMDCNPCKCAANGQSYSCAHSECLEGDSTNKEVEVFMESEGADHIERHSVCKPRDTFYIGCNTCHCNPYGTDYSCTNKPCPLPADVEIFHELKPATKTKSSNNTKRVVCVANRMFIMDCNTCWCNEDGTSFYCTRRVCTPDSTEEHNTEYPEAEMKLRGTKKECRPNEVFELDCNMCRCNADGKSFSCTRRACVDADDKNATLTRKTRAAQEGARTCQPSSEFRMDCNKCLCNDDGLDFSCTRIDCAAQNGNGGGDGFAGTRSKRELSETVAMQCVAGSVFDRQCNVCRCTADGQHAVCTLKRCKQETTDTETESTPSFRCTPGDQFKRECNDCTCSADGKTVFCTLRLCDEELADIDVGQSVV